MAFRPWGISISAQQRFTWNLETVEPNPALHLEEVHRFRCLPVYVDLDGGNVRSRLGYVHPRVMVDPAGR